MVYFTNDIGQVDPSKPSCSNLFNISTEVPYSENNTDRGSGIRFRSYGKNFRFHFDFQTNRLTAMAIDS